MLVNCAVLRVGVVGVACGSPRIHRAQATPGISRMLQLA